MNRLCFFTLGLSLSAVCFAERLRPESAYVKAWANTHEGKAEVTLSDRSRCDYVTATHAIEFDFADKWYEAIGQALHYARLTGKRAGIVLILESESDARYLDQLKKTVEYHRLPIDVRAVRSSGAKR